MWQANRKITTKTKIMPANINEEVILNNCTCFRLINNELSVVINNKIEKYLLTKYDLKCVLNSSSLLERADYDRNKHFMNAINLKAKQAKLQKVKQDRKNIDEVFKSKDKKKNKAKYECKELGCYDMSLSDISRKLSTILSKTPRAIYAAIQRRMVDEHNYIDYDDYVIKVSKS